MICDKVSVSLGRIFWERNRWKIFSVVLRWSSDHWATVRSAAFMIVSNWEVKMTG